LNKGCCVGVTYPVGHVIGKAAGAARAEFYPALNHQIVNFDCFAQ